MKVDYEDAYNLWYEKCGANFISENRRVFLSKEQQFTAEPVETVLTVDVVTYDIVRTRRPNGWIHIEVYSEGRFIEDYYVRN